MYTLKTIRREGKWDDNIISKQDLFQQYSLHERDLNIIDENRHFKVSDIIDHNNAILIKFDFIRCIISKDVAHFIIGQQNKKKNMPLLKQLFEDISQLSLNDEFELKIMDTIFANVLRRIANVVKALGSQTSSLIVDKNNNEDFFARLETALISIEFEIDDIYDLLENFDESSVSYDHVDNDKYTRLLNEYKKSYEGHSDDVKKMRAWSKIHLDIYNTMLASKRNTIAEYNLNIQLLMFGISLSSLITSYFGMNIVNHVEESEHAYIVILVSIILAIIMAYAYTLHRYHCLLKSNNKSIVG
jgi:hypothetical protein